MHLLFWTSVSFVGLSERGLNLHVLHVAVLQYAGLPAEPIKPTDTCAECEQGNRDFPRFSEEIRGLGDSKENRNFLRQQTVYIML